VSSVSITIQANFDSVVDYIVADIHRGPRGKPDDPAALRFERVREPYVFRFSYQEQSAQREVAATFSRPGAGVLESHSHTRNRDGRVGCLFIRDMVHADGTTSLWTRTLSFRMAPTLSWRFLGALFATSSRRSVRTSLETGKRHLEVGLNRAGSC
jgi:hypothetical protein